MHKIYWPSLETKCSLGFFFANLCPRGEAPKCTLKMLVPFSIHWNSIAKLPFAAEGLNVTSVFLVLAPLVPWHLSCALHSVYEVTGWMFFEKKKIGFNLSEPWSALKKLFEELRSNWNLFAVLWSFVSPCKVFLWTSVFKHVFLWTSDLSLGHSTVPCWLFW